jgi:hypothetical protein
MNMTRVPYDLKKTNYVHMKTFSYICKSTLAGLTILAGLAFASCSDMTDTQKEFVEMGTRIYAGKIDSLTVRGGDHRVEISGLMYYAYTAESCMITWENDTVTVPLQGYAIDDTFKVIIPNLEENFYQFFVKTIDREGNFSVQETCAGYAYGEQAALKATPKLVSQMQALPSGDIKLVWNTSEDAVNVEIVYESDAGEETLLLPGNVEETLLSDWKLGGYLKIRTQILPEEEAIDMLYTNQLTQYFPEFVEFEIDKTKIMPLKLPNDATTGYDGRIEGVFDGIIDGGGAQFHSGDGVGVPQHLTFDLGVQTTLTRLEMWARSDGYNNWNPKKIQFWGIGDIPQSELPGKVITLPSMDSGWEAEAQAKGWTKLLDATCSDPVNNRLQFDTPATKIRYLIVRTTEVHGGPSSGSGAYVILREITLHADLIEELD